MPALDRSTLQRPYCPACGVMHGLTVACPPRGVWLASWSLAVNGRRRWTPPKAEHPPAGA